LQPAHPDRNQPPPCDRSDRQGGDSIGALVVIAADGTGRARRTVDRLQRRHQRHTPRRRIRHGRQLLAARSGQTANYQCQFRGCTRAQVIGSIDLINIPIGSYTLTRDGIDDDLNLTADLDIDGSVTLDGAGGAGDVVISSRRATAAASST
jgi:hypothetical protein